MDFLLSFNGAESTCDKIELIKANTDEGKIVKLVLHDLAELGNEEFKAGVLLKKFKFKNSRLAEAKRFSRYDGKKVREVYRFEKDKEGNFKSVSLKRYKRSLIHFTYPLGGIVCRPN